MTQAREAAGRTTGRHLDLWELAEELDRADPAQYGPLSKRLAEHVAMVATEQNRDVMITAPIPPGPQTLTVGTRVVLATYETGEPWSFGAVAEPTAEEFAADILPADRAGSIIEWENGTRQFEDHDDIRIVEAATFP